MLSIQYAWTCAGGTDPNSHHSTSSYSEGADGWAAYGAKGINMKLWAQVSPSKRNGNNRHGMTGTATATATAFGSSSIPTPTDHPSGRHPSFPRNNNSSSSSCGNVRPLHTLEAGDDGEYFGFHYESPQRRRTVSEGTFRSGLGGAFSGRRSSRQRRKGSDDDGSHGQGRRGRRTYLVDRLFRWSRTSYDSVLQGKVDDGEGEEAEGGGGGGDAEKVCTNEGGGSPVGRPVGTNVAVERDGSNGGGCSGEDGTTEQAGNSERPPMLTVDTEKEDDGFADPRLRMPPNRSSATAPVEDYQCGGWYHGGVADDIATISPTGPASCPPRSFGGGLGVGVEGKNAEAFSAGLEEVIQISIARDFNVESHFEKLHRQWLATQLNEPQHNSCTGTEICLPPPHSLARCKTEEERLRKQKNVAHLSQPTAICFSLRPPAASTGQNGRSRLQARLMGRHPS